ncbi:hypothetical protein CCACVL1_03129 [Corchorus capsularis]|uniref:DUF4216 domain-containing protein n=1 Tax=Corchorus capsularis TaxID=210143 RepID=A0A1R3K2F6_COCAP|nr:hypothetical protein CCACVL1_03129 [Corchorus capsularis]
MRDSFRRYSLSGDSLKGDSLVMRYSLKGDSLAMRDSLRGDSLEGVSLITQDSLRGDGSRSNPFGMHRGAGLEAQARRQVENIIQLEYFHRYKSLLFKCEWFDPEKGVRVNPLNGRVEIKHKAMLASNRPSEQFCFSPFSSSQCEWRAVFKPKPKSNYELLSIDKGVVADCTHMKGFESIETAKDVLDAGVGCGEAVKDVLDAGVGSMESAKGALDVAFGPEEVGSEEAAKDTLDVAAGSGEAIQDVLDAGVGFMEAAKDALDAAVGPEEAVQDVVDAGIGSREATKDALNAGVDSMETVKDVQDTSSSRFCGEIMYRGRPLGVGRLGFLEGEEYDAANICALSNYAELAPYFKLFDEMVRRDSPSITDEELINARHTRFMKWFKQYGQENKDKLDPHIYSISYGPSDEVKSFNGYYINGFKFHKLEYGKTLKQKNFGVCVRRCHYKDRVCDFYGILVDVIELCYDVPKLKFLLFKCDWFDPEKGVRVAPFGRIEIKHKAMLASNRPFVLAEQAEQFYLPIYIDSQCEWCEVHIQRRRWAYELPSGDKGVVADCTHMKGFESREGAQDVLDVGVGCGEAVKNVLNAGIGSGEAAKNALDAGIGSAEAVKDALDAVVGSEEAVQDVVDAGIGSKEAAKDALNAGVDSETVKDVHDTSSSRSAASNSVCGPPKRKANDTNEQVLEEIRVLRAEMHDFMAKMQKMIETRFQDLPGQKKKRFQDLESNNRRRL